MRSPTAIATSTAGPSPTRWPRRSPPPAEPGCGASTSECSRGDVVNAVRSPRILDDGWGHITVEGAGRCRDAKVWPGGGRAWDWNETGTRHRPGIQPADVQELLDHKPDVVVLSRGRRLRLNTCPETLALLAEQGVRVEQCETGLAIELYNRLVESGTAAAALLHSTC